MATLNLEKGENKPLALAKGGTLNQVKVGLGWDINNTSGNAFDLDAVAVLLNAEGKLHSDTNSSVLYYNNLTVLNGVAKHLGDNRTGQGEGDDETMILELGKMPESVQKIKVFATIYQAQSRNQNFGQVQNAYARVYADGEDLTVGDSQVSEIKYDLTEDFSTAYSVEIVEIYRHNGSWKLKALGNGKKEELNAVLSTM